MARTYATVDASIWGNDEFCALTAGAQRTYFMLITQSDITAAGTLALTMRRWAKTCAEKDLDVWLAELEDARFVLVDEDSEETLVRTFMKWDGGYKHPRRRQAVVATAHALRSDTLRKVALEELAKLTDTGASPVRTESHSNSTAEGYESRRFLVKEEGDDLEPETSILEREPSGSDPEPSEFCQKHPNGTDKACGPCATSRQRHARWAKREERRKRAARERADAAVIAEIQASKAAAVPPPADFRQLAKDVS